MAAAVFTNIIKAAGLWLDSELTDFGLRHLPLTHAAAWGAIRRKDRYSQHVANVLSVMINRTQRGRRR